VEEILLQAHCLFFMPVMIAKKRLYIVKICRLGSFKPGMQLTETNWN